MNGTVSGVFAALGISLSAAVSMPLVNVLTELTPMELMVARGGVTAIMTLVFFWERIEKPSGKMIGGSLIFSLATLVFYISIRLWGVNPTLVVLTTTPVVNIAAKIWRGQVVQPRVYACLIVLVLGVSVALNPWQSALNLMGFLLSLAAVVLAGLGYEVFSGEKGVSPYHKTFWWGTMTAGVGACASLLSWHIPFIGVSWSVEHLFALLGFSVMNGFFYFFAIAIAFDGRLKTEVASVLAMMETPFVVASAGFLLGEKMSAMQWSGVLLAFAATTVLAWRETASQE